MRMFAQARAMLRPRSGEAMPAPPISERAAFAIMSPTKRCGMPTAGKLAVTIAAVRGIAPEDIDRDSDPLWPFLGAFSTVYIDAARARFLAGHYTHGLNIEEALAEIMANLEDESFGTVL